MAKNSLNAPLVPAGSSVPSNCAAIVAHDESNGAGKAFAGAVTSPDGSTITYFFKMTSNQPDGTQTNLEDCAYANGDPSNIKYATESSNPPFKNHIVYQTITVNAQDSVCDRAAITNADGSVDYTNLVGSSNGQQDPSACAQPPQVAEVPAGMLTALAGFSVIGAAAWLARRRRTWSTFS